MRMHHMWLLGKFNDCFSGDYIDEPQVFSLGTHHRHVYTTAVQAKADVREARTVALLSPVPDLAKIDVACLNHFFKIPSCFFVSLIPTLRWDCRRIPRGTDRFASTIICYIYAYNVGVVSTQKGRLHVA